jgi:hypothetical protein
LGSAAELGEEMGAMSMKVRRSNFPAINVHEFKQQSVNTTLWSYTFIFKTI